MKTAKKTRIKEFEFQDYGVEGSQYFQGAGTSFTKWDTCFVGIGDSLREAYSDALESACQSLSLSDSVIARMEKEILQTSDAKTVEDGSEDVYQHGVLFIR